MASDQREGFSAGSGPESPPERLSAASFRILRREEEVVAWDEVR